MPPKKRVIPSKAEVATEQEIDEAPSNPKKNKKTISNGKKAQEEPLEKKELLLPKKMVTTKRGAQLKSEDYDSPDELVEKKDLLPPKKMATTKRGAQLKTEDYDAPEEPVEKRGRSKPESAKKSEAVPKKITKKTDQESQTSKRTTVKKTETKIQESETKKVKKSTKPLVEEESQKASKKKADTKKVTKDKAKNEKPKAKKDTEGVASNTTLMFSCKKKNAEGKLPDFKITSWNVSGLRAWLKKDGLDILENDSPDILCLQETKCSQDKLPSEITELENYHQFWCESKKNGYAGVGLLTKEEPINVKYGIADEQQDEDGRCLTAEFESFYLINVYVPNAGRKLVTLDKRLKWNESFKRFVKELDKKKPVILCGDLNVAHNEIDLKNPKSNTKNAGFTQEERDGMTDFLQEGFIDTFRSLYPDQTDAYTFWSYIGTSREKNIGWRLDYFLVSSRLENKICDNVIHDKVMGSDHCPITLFISF